MTAGDPFGTAALRARVLDAWAASPARFREDANAEEDLVRGGYRDRVVVELAQNAADAAARAGVPGRLSLTLRDHELVASNVGAPLDAAGVESLSTLRASSKRDDAGHDADAAAAAGAAVGRFGVGFAAVLAVSDDPQVLSTGGGVLWSAAAAYGEAAAVPGLGAEIARRGGHVPVLRLPYPASGAPEEGFTTTVRLPLRDEPAVDLVRRLLDELDDALLLALPALERIDVGSGGRSRALTAAGRWQVVRRAGRVEAHLLLDRPVEERHRPTWSVTWARPLAGQAVPGGVHAPTPTDEPLDLPAMLVASFPLDPSRRHVAPGPLTDALVEEAAAAYVELVQGVAEVSDRLALVPGPVPAGRLDGALRAAVLERLAVSPVLRTVRGDPVAPRDAVSVLGAGAAATGVLGDVVAGLVPDHAVLGRLGVRRLPLADAVDLLAHVDRDPSWWHGLYGSLAEGVVDPEALGALPVPLADGRLVRGPRGALLPTEDLPAVASTLGLRVVDREAAHPLLLRLGATSATARTVLERPEVREAVSGGWELDDPRDREAVTAAVLALVAACDLRPGELPWLRQLPLPDAEGEPAAADELLLPGSALSVLADPQVIGEVDDQLVGRWGARVLAAVGVLTDLTVVEVHDVVLDPAAIDDDGPLPALADWARWVTAGLGPTDVPPTVRTLLGLPELDVVADDSWDELLARVAAHPELRAAVTGPVTVDRGEAGHDTVPSHAAWWVRTHALLGGRPPGEWAVPGAPGLAGLYDEVAGLDCLDLALLAAVGVRASLDALAAEPGGVDELLARLGDPAREVPVSTIRAAYRLVAGLSPESVTPPAMVRVGPGVVLPPADVVVLDAPHHLQLAWPRPPLVVPLAWADDLAEVLGVACSSELVDDGVTGGSPRPVPDVARRILDGPGTRPWQEHDVLTVDGREVTWWVDSDGTVHASTLDGLARGLAWAAGRWDERLLLAAALSDPERVTELLAEAALRE